MSKYVSEIIEFPWKLDYSKYEVRTAACTLALGIMRSDSDLLLHLAPGLIEFRTFWSQ